MLHCRGGRIYTGHTDDLERRIAQHQSGSVSGFTRDFAPVELVWSQEMVSRVEALEAERRIKGWSRAKKLALIRGDWEAISVLAESKGSPSTSLGRTEVSHTNPRVTGTTLNGTLATSGRLDKALAEVTGLSRERVKSLIAAGAITIDNKPATSPAAKAREGMSYIVTLPPPVDPVAQPEEIPLAIVYEDEHLLVVDKPAGLVVHPAAGNRTGTLVNALLYHCKGELSGINGVARPGIVHRIDKDTSGLLVVAKTDAAHEGLAAQFADHSIHRRYLAVCAGHPDPAAGTIAGRLGRSERNRKKMAVLAPGVTRGKHAVTHYKTLQTMPGCALLECRLETGRTHQVRVHCSSIGNPLLGDQVYGMAPARLAHGLGRIIERLDFTRQALHAAELGFIHPASGETVSFSADLPPDMQELIDETAR
ncbi:UPF0213 protein [Alteripontixanthobacter maritimus]|uniref:Ribosomal large subunit pseudouridine synthase D n=2 Tax=Alteripontixanthobacter maritimus TaxID=2161824 RepID=A0A369Q2X1_9SPHN|nr:UPF0213 protein [Alteripontixanthobacter maritimus]